MKKIKMDHFIDVNYKIFNKEIKFKIVSDRDIAYLQCYFINWVHKTKVYSAESFCRYCRKMDRKGYTVSYNYYLNQILAITKFKNRLEQLRLKNIFRKK